MRVLQGGSSRGASTPPRNGGPHCPPRLAPSHTPITRSSRCMQKGLQGPRADIPGGSEPRGGLYGKLQPSTLLLSLSRDPLGASAPHPQVPTPQLMRPWDLLTQSTDHPRESESLSGDLTPPEILRNNLVSPGAESPAEMPGGKLQGL